MKEIVHREAARGRTDDIADSIKADLEFLAGLPENWDEDGGGPYSRRQLSRVEEWWEGFVEEYNSEFSLPPPVPDIGQAEGQSIDVFWDGDFSLLVNIPEDENEPCTFSASGVSDSAPVFQGMGSLESFGKAIRNIVRDYCA